MSKKKKKKLIKKKKGQKKKREEKKTKKAKQSRGGNFKIYKRQKSLPSELSEGIRRTRIRVIGVGGGGSSVVFEIAQEVKRADFVAANTDRQALRGVARSVRTFQFGQNLTGGLGCGMDPKMGEKAAKEDSSRIAKLFRGIDLCVLVATLGGGTGSGSTPEFAKIAKEMKVFTFGIFTLPFKFEGGRKAQVAKTALEKIIPQLNAFCLIPNENIFKVIDKSTPIVMAFSSVNRRLADNLRGLLEMIYLPGLVNIDFADLKTILQGQGKLSYLNSAAHQGQNRAEEAVKEVLKSPLIEYGISGAERIIYNITASQDLRMKEVEHISRAIADFNKKAKIIFGISQDKSYKDKLRITLLAVGCGRLLKPKTRPRPKPEPEPKPKPEPEPKPEIQPKPQPKPQPQKPQLKSQPKPKLKPKKPKPKPAPAPTRKNALDLKKEAEKTERELLEQENQWDIPAFLRKRQEEGKSEI